jgi:hypothetical protein
VRLCLRAVGWVRCVGHSANTWLLQTVARDAWGFNGYVTADVSETNLEQWCQSKGVWAKTQLA